MGGESRQAALQRVERALDAGTFTEASTLLNDVEPCAARAFFEARIARRLGKPADIVAVLKDARERGLFASKPEQALACAMLAWAYTENRETLSGEAELKSLSGFPDSARTDDVEYYRAFAYYMLGHTNKAAQLLQHRTPVDPVVRARYLILRGYIFAQCEQFNEQAAATRSALVLLLEHAPNNAYLIASAAWALGTLARELNLPTALDVVSRAEAEIAWPDDLAREHFNILRAIGWNYALHGRRREANTYLMRGLDTAKTAAQKMLAHLDRACTADADGVSELFLSELDLAHDYYKQIDWSRHQDEEAMAPILAAHLNADCNRERALEYLARGDEQRALIPKSMGLGHGERVPAYFSAAAASVYKTIDLNRAIREGKKAYRIFNRIGYRWRAGRAALELHEMTMYRPWLDRAHEAFEPYSNAIVDDVKFRCYANLSPASVRVLGLLQQGLHRSEIATLLGRSQPTVEKQIRALFRAFDVSHIGALLAKAPKARLPHHLVAA